MYQAAGGSDTGWMVEPNSGWLGKLEIDGVDEVGVGGLGGCSGFPVVVRLTYRGFLWGNGVLGPLTGFRPGETILGGSRGGGQFGTGYKP